MAEGLRGYAGEDPEDCSICGGTGLYTLTFEIAIDDVRVASTPCPYEWWAGHPERVESLDDAIDQHWQETFDESG